MSLDSILNFVIPPVVIIAGFYLMFRPLKKAFITAYEKARELFEGKKSDSIVTIQYE